MIALPFYFHIINSLTSTRPFIRVTYFHLQSIAVQKNLAVGMDEKQRVGFSMT
jgi:hypothetical protein